jgi:diguanylate cyclase (GGDEF)-like protein
MVVSIIQILRQEAERILSAFADSTLDASIIVSYEGRDICGEHGKELDAIFRAAALARASICDAVRARAEKISKNELIEVQTIFHARLDELLSKKIRDLVENRAIALIEQAERDPVTMLPNRAAFNRKLQEEIERARRYHRELSLVLFDVDRFKSINDQFGHPAGDRALAQVAFILKSSLRQSDALFRYGGDEFAAICPETPGDAISYALRRLESSMPTCRAESCLPEQLDISWGAASFPADGVGERELICVADHRLYECKQAHRRSCAAWA